MSSKMANATGTNEKLAKAGVDVNDLSNPIYADKVKSVMGSISDPKILNAVADQLGVNPAAGLPTSANNSLVGALGMAAKANPFASLPSQPPADPNAAANLLSKPSIPPAPATPPADPAVKPEPATNPVAWGNNNDPTSFGNMNNTKQAKIDKIDQQLRDLLGELTKNFTTPFNDESSAYTDAQYALDFSKAGARAELDDIGRKYESLVKTPYYGAFDKAKEIATLANTIPKSAPEWDYWDNVRAQNINPLLDALSAKFRNLVDVRKDVIAKIKEAGGS